MSKLYLILVILCAATLLTYVTIIFLDEIWEENFQKQQNHLSSRSDRINHSRALVIVPYFSKYPPVWFQAFLTFAQSSNDSLDWIIFCSQDSNWGQWSSFYVPDNVQIVSLNLTIFARKLLRVTAFNSFHMNPFSTDQVNKVVNLLKSFPYVVVEFKPLLGVIFSEYLTRNDRRYSHWGYGDLDILLGDVSKVLNDPIVSKFDVINFSFGDNHSLYLRAQLVLLRLTQTTLMLWRQCHHFSIFINRLDEFQRSKKWNFQSAEGCLSKQAVDNSNLSIIYLPLQISDAFSGPLADKEVLIVEKGIFRCYGTSFSEHKILNPLVTIYSTTQMLISRSHGRCTYWIDPIYDVCITNVSGDSIMMKIGSASYKHELPMNLKINVCTEGSLFHFQSWKRNFYYHSIKSLNIIGADERLINGVISEKGFFPTHRVDAHVRRNSLVVNCVEFESSLRSCTCMESFNHIPQGHDLTQYYHTVLIGIAFNNDTGYINHYLDVHVENIKKIIVLQVDANHSVSHDWTGIKNTGISTEILYFDYGSLDYCRSTQQNGLYDKVLYNIALRNIYTNWILIVPYKFVVQSIWLKEIQESFNHSESCVAVIFASTANEIKLLRNIISIYKTILSGEESLNTQLSHLPLLPFIMSNNCQQYGDSVISFATEAMGVGCYDWLIYVELIAFGYNIEEKLVSVNEGGFSRSRNYSQFESQCLFKKNMKNGEYTSFLSSIIKYYRRLYMLRTSHELVYSKQFGEFSERLPQFL